MPRTFSWGFPLPRTHTGVLLANGRFGAMIWGGGRRLRITVGRADFWDHRGGMVWSGRQSYAAIRSCLETGDEAELRRLFEETGRDPDTPPRPSVLPIGRLDIDLGAGARLQRADLDIDRGQVAVHLRRQGAGHILTFVLDPRRPLLWIRWPRGLRPHALTEVPAWEYVGDHLGGLGFDPPAPFAGEAARGWTQMRPSDPTLAVAHSRRGSDLLLAAPYGRDAAAARKAAGRLLRKARDEGWGRLRKRNADWWRRYWREAGRVDVPDPHLAFLHDYGMYKFAGLTSPGGAAATLQGAWVEEYQMPPWSNDYHFNINVQMCYGPAYHGNRPEHLRPLFDMISRWTPVLRRNARAFLGIDDGLMLPHAVDDRCTCMGGFWTGSVDHGCTAWVAQMMYRYYRYTMDRGFLRRQAYPFMAGAMRVYEEMLEPEGDGYVLPVSVSPEYRGAALDAWGRNASFQLACIHRLCQDLLDAAAELGVAPRPAWRRIRRGLPRACLQGPGGEEQIALWEATGLEESHRHHSHLAGIVPFDVIDLDDETWRGVVERSLRHWIRTGPGLWSGWCVPWASMIHSRCGNADAAALWLEVWRRLFTNEGRGTLHDAAFPGFSLMGRGALPAPADRPEIMQIEAGMGCVAAIQEMLLHVRGGVTHLFRGAPQAWERVGFERFRTDGAFLVSARRRRGRVGPVTVRSLAGGTLRLANPWPGAALVRRGPREERFEGEVLAIPMRRGESARIRAARGGARL